MKQKKKDGEFHNFYPCTMHYGIYILFTHQQMYFLLNLGKFIFILKYT